MIAIIIAIIQSTDHGVRERIEHSVSPEFDGHVNQTIN